MIENFKDLEKLLKLARKQGVTDLTLNDGKITGMKLGELPSEHAALDAEVEEMVDPLEGFPEGELTPEELTFFANGGSPADNPYRKN